MIHPENPHYAMMRSSQTDVLGRMMWPPAWQARGTPKRAAVFQTADKQDGCYAFKSQYDRPVHSEESCGTATLQLGKTLLARQTRYCISGPTVNAAPNAGAKSDESEH